MECQFFNQATRLASQPRNGPGLYFEESLWILSRVFHGSRGLEAYLFLDGGLFEGGGGLYEGAYKIIVDIKNTLLKDLVYLSRSFFMSIQLITNKRVNLLR